MKHFHGEASWTLCICNFEPGKILILVMFSHTDLDLFVSTFLASFMDFFASLLFDAGPGLGSASPDFYVLKHRQV